MIVAALVAHPPHGGDIANAGAFAAIFVGATVFAASRLVPKRPLTRRSSLRLRLWFATAAVWAVGAFVLTLEVAAIALTGGWLPWFIPVAGGVAVLVLAGWRSDLAGPARCLTSGAWTPIPAAAFDVRPGEPVNGWAVLPNDVRIRFHLPVTPPDVAAELAEGRRLWLAGLAVGTPGRRPAGRRHLLLIGPHRVRPTSALGRQKYGYRRAARTDSLPVVKTVQQSFPAPPEALWNALPAGVAALGGQGPYYEPQRGFVSFRTGMSLLSWGQEITATVVPAAGGSTLTIMTNLKFGLFDWGEGKRIANRFAAAVAFAAGTAALA